ncbi:MAG: transposase [Lachnospiraceae bacterium]|nr:transposase [Lachnospiraceae bacterium]
MAFVSNSSQQISLTDSTHNLTEREKKFLEKSWAKTFADKIFPAIDENLFSVLYSNKASRPNTPVNVIVGALILKEALGDSDDELVQALMFDIRYQYALHTTSFEEQPLSDRTLSRFRARCLAYETETGIDLIHICVTSLAKEISEFMGLTPAMQRMDSLMVAANIRNLSLLELFYTCVANLAKVMVSRGYELPEKQKHYAEKDDYNAFIYHQRELDANARTILVMHDAEKLLEISEGDFDDTSEYQLLIRLLKEQTITDDDGTRRLREKKEKEDPSKVLMNPSDPEATFRKKAGKKHFGYVANLTETVDKNKSLITNYAYEQNIYSDSQLLKEHLEQEQVYENGVIMVTDGAYGSELNVAKAAEHGIKLITTNFTGRKPADIFADFIFSEDGHELLECINHKKPFYTHYDAHNDRCNANFHKSDCENCPYLSECNPQFRTGYALRELSWKAVNRAKQLRYMQTNEFAQYAHFRNGVEALVSLLRRKYHVDKIPTHGKKQTRLHFGFKVAALNFQKLLDYENSLVKHTFKKEIA